jgi:hypothetical protein
MAAFFGIAEVRAYANGMGILPFPGSVALVAGTIAVLVHQGSIWGWRIQLVALILGLLAFPLTFVSVMLLGYMTRPETVSYFRQRSDGPRWDTPRTWRKGEWPWLLGLAAGVALSAFFLAVMLALLRTHPNL